MKNDNLSKESPNKRETVGKVASDLMAKTDQGSAPVMEIAEAATSEYMDNVMHCVNKDYDRYKNALGFYVVVDMKREMLLTNVIRNFFYSRRSCPTPWYDQTVFYFDKTTDALELLWVIPAKDTCVLFLQNEPFIDGEEKKLLQWVLEFRNGTLLKECKKRNKEVPSLILTNA